MLERTSKGREKLIEAFSEWLIETGLTFETFLNPAETDIDGVNAILQCYGRALPYGHYSETINAIASLRPLFRRALQGAWDVAYTWLRHEPGKYL